MMSTSSDDTISEMSIAVDLPRARLQEKVPPNIQPRSGFMGNGKVIRPIAFKPMSSSSMSGRLSNVGERYGSTPVLTSRPGSHLTLYGSSSDLRSRGAWSCASPQPCSLQPEHHHHTDKYRATMCSVRGDSTGDRGRKETSPAPSPSDSGVSELGARDTQEPYIDRTMRSYQEKDRHWEREVRRMKAVHEGRHQKSLKMEQVLMMQVYQLQQDNRRLTQDNERMAKELCDTKKEMENFRSRLEETEWSVCQKTGEIAFLKTQLKEAQNEKTAKGHEFLQLKAELRQTRELSDRKDNEITCLKNESENKEKNIKHLQSEVNRLNYTLKSSESELNKSKESSIREIERLKTDLKELREELSDISLSNYEGIESGRVMRGIYEKCKNEPGEYHWNSNDSSLEDAEVQRLIGDLPDLTCSPPPCESSNIIERLKCEMHNKESLFETERRKWSEEKEKVLRYQKQLQDNYVKMLRRSRTLESEIEALRLELELCNKNMKNLSQFGKTIHL